jgi:cell division protein ZapA
MKQENRHYKVHISGTDYTLMSDEPQEHVMQAAAMVDQLMVQLTEKSPNIEAKKAAVLIALRIASDLLHAQTLMTTCTNRNTALIQQIDQVLLLCTS